MQFLMGFALLVFCAASARWIVPTAVGACMQSGQPATGRASSILVRWDSLEKNVRDGRLPRPRAREELNSTVEQLRSTFSARKEAAWVFPVAGGSLPWIGGSHGSGFRPTSPPPAYSWYDGNRHGGHPGHDVFIPDRDRDCRSDGEGRPFYALSMQPGTVISINELWEPGEPRGGKYVWLYNSSLDLFFYYAHLDEIRVRPGDSIGAGRIIGTVGRTGLAKGREKVPCHIHLMVLQYDLGRMTPVDFYPMLAGREPAR